MKKRTRWFLNSLLILVLAFALVQFIRSEVENRHSQEDYDLAIQIAEGNVAGESPAPEEIPDSTGQADAAPESENTQNVVLDPVIEELLAIDLDALRQENEDVIGWIHIPDTGKTVPGRYSLPLQYR